MLDGMHRRLFNYNIIEKGGMPITGYCVLSVQFVTIHHKFIHRFE